MARGQPVARYTAYWLLANCLADGGIPNAGQARVALAKMLKPLKDRPNGKPGKFISRATVAVAARPEGLISAASYELIHMGLAKYMRRTDPSASVPRKDLDRDCYNVVLSNVGRTIGALSQAGHTAMGAELQLDLEIRFGLTPQAIGELDAGYAVTANYARAVESFIRERTRSSAITLKILSTAADGHRPISREFRSAATIYSVPTKL